jgi:hypothetical protein
MSMIYRTTGAWGAGKGSNLTAAEVDGNFYTLLLRIIDLEENPPSPISIADITMTGNQIVIHMTNGEVHGPFNVPVATFTWMEEWTPNTSYNVFDVFIVPGDGQYLVIEPYESATDFDPNASQIVKMFSIPDQAMIPVSDIITPGGGVFQLEPEHMGEYLRFSSETVVALPDVGPDSLFPIGSVVVIYKDTTADVSVGAAPPVIVNTPETLYLRNKGSSATLIKVAAAEWDLIGDLEQADV